MPEEEKKEEASARLAKFETRIRPPKPGPSRGKSHNAHRPVPPRASTWAEIDDDQGREADWQVALCPRDDEDTPRVWQSEAQLMDVANPGRSAWDRVRVNLYGDYCTYAPAGDLHGKPYWFRSAVYAHESHGYILDYDHHRPEDMPLDEIISITTSDEFAACVPYSEVIMTGHGVQVHIPYRVRFDRGNGIHDQINYTFAIRSTMGWIRDRFGLVGDKNCTDVNRLWRRFDPDCVNVKDPDNPVPVRVLRQRDRDEDAAATWVESCRQSFPQETARVTRAGKPLDLSRIDDPKRTVIAAEIARALSHVTDVDDYHVWLTMGFALADLAPVLGDDAAFTLWDSWSSNGGKYDPETCQYKWQTFDAGGGITVGSLFAAAKDQGFEFSDEYLKVSRTLGWDDADGKDVIDLYTRNSRVTVCKITAPIPPRSPTHSTPTAADRTTAAARPGIASATKTQGRRSRARSSRRG